MRYSGWVEVAPRRECTEASGGATNQVLRLPADLHAGHGDSVAGQGGLDGEEGRFEGEHGRGADRQAAVGLLECAGGADGGGGVEAGGEPFEGGGAVGVDQALGRTAGAEQGHVPVGGEQVGHGVADGVEAEAAELAAVPRPVPKASSSSDSSAAWCGVRGATTWSARSTTAVAAARASDAWPLE